VKLLDTSIVIDQIKRGTFERGAISVITLVEILRGVAREKRAEVKRLLEEAYEVLGLGNDVILKYCELYSKLKEKGEPVPDADLLIAATAVAYGRTLVTKDRDFERLARLGLKLELRD